jgi:hypothetical protein
VTVNLVLFARGSEGACLRAIEPPHDSDGSTVGEVTQPLSSAGSKTFLILNANPSIMEISAPGFLRNIDIVAAKDFKALGIFASRAQRPWNEPQEHNIQPGARDNDTNVRGLYPTKDITKGSMVGKADVEFDISYSGRKRLETRLDFSEK